MEEFSSNILLFRKIDYSENKEGKEPGSVIRQTLKTIYELLKMICHENRQNQLIFYKYIPNFIDDFFYNVGAEELVTTIFENNFSLLCKVPE